MKTLLLIILFIIFAIVMWKIAEPGNKAYNKHVCAVYGYYSDCHTPLKPEERLK